MIIILFPYFEVFLDYWEMFVIGFTANEVLYSVPMNVAIKI